MKGKTFVLLLVAAGLLAAISFLPFGGDGQKSENLMGKKLLADLPVNDVTQITIIDSDSQVTMVKGETLWSVQERNNYPADFNELRNLVVKLSKLKIGRTFTGSKESIVRLSLSSPHATDAEGKGRQITLSDTSGKVIADVIIGETRKTESGAEGGQYVKMGDREEVFLVDAGFPFLKTSPSQWLKKEVLNVKADEIYSVTCYAGNIDTPVFSLSRPEKGETAQLTPVPEGRTVNTSKIDQLFDALAPLTLDDVTAVSTAQQVEDTDRTRLVYRLYDGREISVFPTAVDEEKYTVRLAARQVEPTPTAKADVEGKGPPPDEDNTVKQIEDDGSEQASEFKTAQQIDEDVRSWLFTIKKWQFDSLVTQPEMLLEKVEKEGETS